MADKKNEEKAVYLPPTSQVDLEERLARDNMPVPVDFEGDPVLNPEKVYAPYAVEGNDLSAYRGVSPEYMTYSDDTSKPFAAEGGPEEKAEKLAVEGMAVGQLAPSKESNPTVGGGSTVESIHSAFSGEGFTSEVVDREKVYADEAERQSKGRLSDGTYVTTPAPEAKATEEPKPASRGIGK